MYKPKPVSVVCATLFIGVLLSCACYFGITAMMDTQSGQVSTSAENGIVFGTFSDAFYDNDNLNEIISRCEYLVFGNIGSTDIILGENNFLFDAGNYDENYNYLEDYLGIGQFSGIELEALANIINLRRMAYMKQGVDYMMVVIPNSQTVYSDYMPSYMGGISNSTRLNQLSDYLEECGYDFFMNASELLISARKYGSVLYNNTENSLNSLGEWYLYSAVCDRISELYSINGSKVAYGALERYRSYTDGKALARRAGLSSVIKNETVSLSNSAKLRYTLSDYYGSMVKTNIDSEYLTEAQRDTVTLLEFTDEWDRIQLMPYFSDTYAEVAYKSNHQYSGLVIDSLKPDVVVQFIHEYELYSIMSDSNVTLTYNAGLDLKTDPDVTSAPILIAQCPVSESRICVAGETESNALITVTGDTISTVSQYAIGSLFFIEIDIGDNTAATASITAQVTGKQTSKPFSFTLKRSDDTKEKTVAVGSNSQLYPTDYGGLSSLSDTQIKAVQSGFAEKVARLRALSGKNTEYIYVIVPDKLTVYYNDAPERLKPLYTTVEEYKSMVKKLCESAGMTVLDLTDEMKAHTVLEGTYCQTDMLWTGFGSYIGYFSLMSHIAERFASVKIHGLSDFYAAPEKSIGGELVTRLGLDGAVISETHLTLNPDFAASAHFEQSGDSSFDITKAFISYNDKSDLPVAVVTRDAYGTGMLKNMAEHFSKMIVLREGEYTISDELISEIKPDYIITIRCNGALS